MQEKSMRMKLEEELLQIKNRIDHQMRNMRQKIEDEFKSQFNIRQNSMWSKFQDESQHLA